MAAAAALATEEVTAPGDELRCSSTLRPKEKRTLWIGDLDRAEGPVDDIYVKGHMFYEFSSYISSVRICRDRFTRQPSFGFVEFISQKEAQYVLEHMNGRLVPGRRHKYRLNWANFNLTEAPETRTIYSRPPQLNRNNKLEDAAEGAANNEPYRRISNTVCPPDSHSIWVGSLDPSTCREELEDLFAQHYESVCMVKLIMDSNTGACKGFGFVHFRDPAEAERSLEEMNGAICHGRRIKVNKSNNARGGPPGAPGGPLGGPLGGALGGPLGGPQGGCSDPSLQSAMHKIYAATAAAAQQLATDCCGGFVPTKRKRGVLAAGEAARVLVRGLDPSCTEEELRRHLSVFGEVLMVRMSAGGKAVVTFAEAAAAANAIHCLSGASIGTAVVALEPASGEEGVASCGSFEGKGYAVQQQQDTQQQQLLLQQQLQQQQQLQAAQAAAQYAQFYQQQQQQQQQQFAAYCSEALKAQQQAAAAATEEDMGGGLFCDTDPALVPPEFLPRCMYTSDGLTVHGALERHAYTAESPCQLRVWGSEEGKFNVITIKDELNACSDVIEGETRKKMKEKVKRGKPLQPEDLECLYTSDVDGFVAWC